MDTPRTDDVCSIYYRVRNVFLGQNGTVALTLDAGAWWVEDETDRHGGHDSYPGDEAAEFVETGGKTTELRFDRDEYPIPAEALVPGAYLTVDVSIS